MYNASCREQTSSKRRNPLYLIGVGFTSSDLTYQFDPCPGNYWALDQIVPKKLHLLNDETTTFTSDLMDKLEKVRPVDYDSFK